MALDLSNMLNTAFTQAIAQMIDQQAAPLREIVHAQAVDIADLQLRSMMDAKSLPSADAAFLAMRIDVLFTLLSTLIETSDEAIEIAREEHVPGLNPKFRLRDSFAHFIREGANPSEILSVQRIAEAISNDDNEEIVRAICAGDRFDEAVIDAIENRSSDAVKAIREDLDDDSNIEDTIRNVLERGSFNVEFSRR